MANLPITNIASIYQFTRTANTEAYPNTPNYTNVNICISPTGTDIQSSAGGVNSYQLFEIFVMDVTLSLHNGDKLVADNGQSYLIDGMPYTINNAFVQYIRLLCRQVV